MGEGTPANSNRTGSMAGELPVGLRHCVTGVPSVMHTPRHVAVNAKFTSLLFT